MEEILASIRRIMADDDPFQAVPPSPSPHAPQVAEGIGMAGNGPYAAPAQAESSVAPFRSRRYGRVVEPPPQDPGESLLKDGLDVERNIAALVRAQHGRKDSAAGAAPSPAPHAVAPAGNDAGASTAGVSARRSAARLPPVRPPVAVRTQTQAGRQDADPPRDVGAAPRTVTSVPRPEATPDMAARIPLPRKDLLSPTVDVAVATSFKTLGDLNLPQQARTVEDLVKEILRPMLKDWLDQHLAGVVEQLVRAEIERVTRTLR